MSENRRSQGEGVIFFDSRYRMILYTAWLAGRPSQKTQSQRDNENGCKS